MEKYDENLQDNPFFIKLLLLFPSLYEDAPHHKWVICVPRLQSTVVQNCCHEDFQCHILQPLDTPGEQYCTLNGKVVTISGDKILKSESSVESVLVHILFEEIFYNHINESFKVLCISGPLQGYQLSINTEQALFSLNECKGFLRQEVDSLPILDDLLKKCLLQCHHRTFKTVETLKANIRQVYTKFVHYIFEYPNVKRKVLSSQMFHSNLGFAIEMYILHNTYNSSIMDLKDIYSHEDSELNKKIRNSNDIQPKDLQIKSQFWDIMPKAKKELSKLGCYSTPLEKVRCLKRTFACINELSNGFKNLSNIDNAYSTDDVLSLFVYLVLKAGIPNWFAHLIYMKHFSLFSSSENELGENSFHVSTLEAAVEYVRRSIINIPFMSEGFLNDFQIDSFSSSSVTPLFPTEIDMHSIKVFFEFIKDGNVNEVENILKLKNDHLEEDNLCHPLCLCDKCKLLQHKLNFTGKSYLYLRDAKGNTPLHLAVAYGHEDLIDVLIKAGGDTEATNSHFCTPLHIACKRGTQSIELLLLDNDANVNAQDANGNTPLHWATSNCQLNCVKTLLYYNEHKHLKLNLNCINHAGDTPLHIAARWGYDEIVEILMQFGCDASLLNKIRQSCLDCAHNRKIYNLLTRICYKAPFNCSPESVSEGLTVQKRTVRKTDRHINNVLKNEQSQEILNSSTKQESTHLTNELSGKIDRLLKAVKHNDFKLVCFYLGLTHDEIEETLSLLPQRLCHPLCQCDKCLPVQQVASSGYRRSLTCGLSVNCHNEYGTTPLHEACASGHRTIVEFLLRSGAFINVQDCQGFTPLHVACRGNKQKIADILVKSDALVNMVNFDGNAPLYYSCELESLTIPQLLLENGADVNHVNHVGDSALHNAVRNDAKDVVELLLENGARISLMNHKRETAQDLAKSLSIIQLLKRSQSVLQKVPL